MPHGFTVPLHLPSMLVHARRGPTLHIPAPRRFSRCPSPTKASSRQRFARIEAQRSWAPFCPTSLIFQTLGTERTFSSISQRACSCGPIGSSRPEEFVLQARFPANSQQFLVCLGPVPTSSCRRGPRVACSSRGLCSLTDDIRCKFHNRAPSTKISARRALTTGSLLSWQDPAFRWTLCSA